MSQANSGDGFTLCGPREYTFATTWITAVGTTIASATVAPTDVSLIGMNVAGLVVKLTNYPTVTLNVPFTVTVKRDCANGVFSANLNPYFQDQQYTINAGALTVSWTDANLSSFSSDQDCGPDTTAW